MNKQDINLFKSDKKQTIVNIRMTEKRKFSLYEENKLLQESCKLTKELIEILTKTKRKLTEINKIARFLCSFSNFVNFIKLSHSCLDDLIYYVSSKIKHEFYPPFNFLFKIGDYGDKFYIILKGSVSIMIQNKFDMLLSFKDYYYFIAKLYLLDEKELFRINTESNPFTYHTSKELNDLFYQIELDNNLLNNDLSVKLLSEASIKICVIYLKAKQELIPNIKTIKIKTVEERKIKHSITIDRSKRSAFGNDISLPIKTEYNLTANEYIKLLNPSSNTSDINKQKLVPITSLKIFSLLNAGDKFGEIALTNKVKARTASIYFNEETNLGSFDQKSFKQCIQQIDLKQRGQFMSNLSNNQLFKNCSQFSFKIIFEKLRSFKIAKGEVIIQEENESNDLIFIINGEFEINCNKSIYDVVEIISKLTNNPEYKKKKIDFNNNYYKNKKFMVLGYVSVNCIIGLNELILDNKSMFNLICKSKTAEIFKGDRETIFNICKQDLVLKQNLKMLNDSKTNIMIDKLDKYVENKLKLTDSIETIIERQITENSKVKDLNYQTISHTVSHTSNKASIVKKNCFMKRVSSIINDNLLLKKKSNKDIVQSGDIVTEEISNLFNFNKTTVVDINKKHIKRISKIPIDEIHIKDQTKQDDNFIIEEEEMNTESIFIPRTSERKSTLKVMREFTESLNKKKLNYKLSSNIITEEQDENVQTTQTHRFNYNKLKILINDDDNDTSIPALSLRNFKNSIKTQSSSVDYNKGGVRKINFLAMDDFNRKFNPSFYFNSTVKEKLPLITPSKSNSKHNRVISILSDRSVIKEPMTVKNLKVSPVFSSGSILKERMVNSNNKSKNIKIKLKGNKKATSKAKIKEKEPFNSPNKVNLILQVNNEE